MQKYSFLVALGLLFILASFYSGYKFCEVRYLKENLKLKTELLTIKEQQDKNLAIIDKKLIDAKNKIERNNKRIHEQINSSDTDFKFTDDFVRIYNQSLHDTDSISNDVTTP